MSDFDHALARIDSIADRWREGEHGLPVIVRMRLTARGIPEWNDRRSARAEPAPEMTAPVPIASESVEWWERGYPGGPMVVVDGFPRALYPPDDKQGRGSSDGPDVVAYKRTVSRAGRWPWGTFDDSYSNGFAHGKSGNVSETGIAGVQRQLGIDATGNIGERTFNGLRSIRIPEGLPHAGEPAMDATAVRLVNEAYQRATEPPATPDDVERAITEFCTTSIRCAPSWTYDQLRPMDHYTLAPDEPHLGDDCSEHATTCYSWARHVTGVAVPDPNRYCDGFGGFNGYGWTGSLVYAPECSSPYRVGDLGIYGSSKGNTTHVVTCYHPGDADEAEWCSNGSDEAPYGVELHYRGDLVCVVRPGLTP